MWGRLAERAVAPLGVCAVVLRWTPRTLSSTGSCACVRTRRFRLAHIAALPARAVVGRVAPCSSCDYHTGVAAVVMVADALGSRAGGMCPEAVFAIGFFIFSPRQAREAALRLAHGAAVV